MKPFNNYSMSYRMINAITTLCNTINYKSSSFRDEISSLFFKTRSLESAYKQVLKQITVDKKNADELVRQYNQGVRCN